MKMQWPFPPLSPDSSLLRASELHLDCGRGWKTAQSRALSPRWWASLFQEPGQPPAAHLWLQWSHFTFGLRHRHHHGHWKCSRWIVNKACLTRSINIIMEEKLLSLFFSLLVLNSLPDFMKTLQVCQSYQLPPKYAKGSLVRSYCVYVWKKMPCL